MQLAAAFSSAGWELFQEFLRLITRYAVPLAPRTTQPHNPKGELRCSSHNIEDKCDTQTGCSCCCVCFRFDLRTVKDCLSTLSLIITSACRVPCPTPCPIPSVPKPLRPSMLMCR